MTTSENMTPQPEKLFTPKQCAETLGVSTYTMQKWLREDKVHGVKIGKGKHWRVSYSELLRISKEHFG